MVMSNVVPHNTQISHSGFRTVGDFALIHSLLKNSALYQIPDDLRPDIVDSIKDVFNDPDSTLAQKLAATKVVLEMDKRNLDVVKIAMPQRVEHTQVKDLSDEELANELRAITAELGNDRSVVERIE